LINQRRVARFHDRITSGMAHPDFTMFASLVEQYRSENDVPIEQIAASLAALAAGEAPLLMTEDLKPTSFVQSRDPRIDSRPAGGQRPFDGGRRVGPNRRSEHGPAPRRCQAEMETFRIEVGHAHQVKPGNIVGAIANETGLDSSNIGRIEIFDEHSTVDLLVGMPRETFHALKQVWVAGRRLNITRMHETAAADKPAADAIVVKKPKKAKKAKPEPEVASV
jgi:ATP-dependent RNA helicase DeaD